MHLNQDFFIYYITTSECATITKGKLMPLNGTGQLLNQDGTTLGMHRRAKTGMKRQMHVSVALISISHREKKNSHYLQQVGFVQHLNT